MFVSVVLTILALHEVVATPTSDLDGLTEFGAYIGYQISNRCLKNQGNFDQSILDKWSRVQSCVNIDVQPKGVTDDVMTRLCHNAVGKAYGCLEDGVAAIVPCLKPEEKFLEQYLLAAYNSSFAYYCDHISLFHGTKLLTTMAGKCLAGFNLHSERNPNNVCLNDLVDKLKEAKDLVTKDGICWASNELNTCYGDALDKHCSDAPELKEFQEGFIAALSKDC